jgi:hypothetical protein
MSEENKKVYREKDKLARESVRLNMSPEKRRFREKKGRENVRLKVPKKLRSKKNPIEKQ